MDSNLVMFLRSCHGMCRIGHGALVVTVFLAESEPLNGVVAAALFGLVVMAARWWYVRNRPRLGIED
jgi:hypothetical protein